MLAYSLCSLRLCFHALFPTLFVLLSVFSIDYKSFYDIFGIAAVVNFFKYRESIQNIRKFAPLYDNFLLYGKSFLLHRRRNQGAPGARAPPSFQSVPCPLYMSCTTMYFNLCHAPPIKKSFLHLCLVTASFESEGEL